MSLPQLLPQGRSLPQGRLPGGGARGAEALLLSRRWGPERCVLTGGPPRRRESQGKSWEKSPLVGWCGRCSGWGGIGGGTRGRGSEGGCQGRGQQLACPQGHSHSSLKEVLLLVTAPLPGTMALGTFVSPPGPAWVSSVPSQRHPLLPRCVLNGPRPSCLCPALGCMCRLSGRF